MATQVKLNQLIQDAATDGQVITWDNALSKWKPGTPTGGAGSSGDYGYIQYSDGAGGFLSDTPNLFWDDTDQLLGIGVSAVPTAKLHITGSPSGAANTASLKLNSGDVLITPEAGVIENNGTSLFYTNDTGDRFELAASGDTGAIQYTGTIPGQFSADATKFAWDLTGEYLHLNGASSYNMIISGADGIRIDPAITSLGTYNVLRGELSAVNEVKLRIKNTNATSSTAHAYIRTATVPGGGDPYFICTNSIHGASFGVDTLTNTIVIAAVDVKPRDTSGFPKIVLNSWNDGTTPPGIGVFVDVPTALFHIGSNYAGDTRPALKFDGQALIDTPEAGSVEYDGYYLYYTDVGNARWRLLSSNDPALADGDKGDITVSSGGTVWQINDNVIVNSDLTSGTGGIYKGSGTIETGTTALLASGSSLYFNYSGNFAGIVIADNGDDATGLIILNSYDQNTQVSVSNGEVSATTDEVVTLRSPLYSIGHGALGDTVMELGRGCSSFKMQFFEPSGFTNYTEFSAGDQSAIISYVFPLTEGTDGQVMTWNTGGQLSWETPTTGAPSSGIAGAVQFSDGSGGFNSDATNFFFNDSTNQLQLKGGSAYNLAITGSAVGGVSVVPASTVTGDYVNFKGQVSATGLSDLQITNTNTSNSGAHSRIQLQTGTGGGDPFLRFLSNEIVYIMGFDQSASKFVIGTGDDPSTMTDTNVTLTGKHLGIMQTSPTAYLHLGAGTATANTAPIKLTTGTALTTPEDGAIEYHGSHIYFTIGSTRYQLDQQGGGISDADYGDITVSSSGSIWTIDNTAVTLAKIANATANNKLLGSGATGSGSSYEQISIGSDLTMTGTTLSVTAATTSLAGKVELATTSETTIGTDTTRAVTPKGLSESVYGAKVVTVLVTDPNGADLTTGDGKVYIPINGWITGMNLIDCSASVSTASTSGLPTVQLRRVRSGTPVDILTTKITIDANEVDSSTATTPFAINTSNDDMLTGDQIYIDVDVAGTGTKGLAVTLVFQTP